jgi:hypothetical protein
MRNSTEFLTVAEAAQLTGYSPWSIRRWPSTFGSFEIGAVNND